VVIVPFQTFTDSSCGGIVEKNVQCAQSTMHLVKSAALSGSSRFTRLHSSMNFGNSKLIKNFNYCLQQY